MNHIAKKPINALGYNFISKEFIPKGKNEYYLRNIQNRNGQAYRKLLANEIKTLVQNGNSSDDWEKIRVTNAFDPRLVRNCTFFGLVRIGKLEPYFHEFNNLRMPVGIYNSTIISCDIGDNAVIDNINYMSHYIIGNNVMLVNINELATTEHSKFGNGVIKKGEPESVRIWIEVCNENAGRSILPFNGMQTADAWLWSRYRDDEKLLAKFREFTDKRFDNKRGYYGKIGDRTVIKNCRIIKDVWIGSDAYIKGANKLKNLTINSSEDEHTQIGEGCELVNGIIGFGCRLFYGVKAVRFILGDNSQLKYGARLINSFLGENSTISCCEVLNSLIFSSHEQHHNNSFLCAATVLGQSNMAAGATIGSNHNSRGADGEIIAGRGFWPGLCVSLKHNSKFASFNIIAKGDFPAELNIPIPFSLISNDVPNDKLLVMPGYWFQYNMYALARNVFKYESRDKRTDKTRIFEYDFLAPDSINEMFEALQLLCKLTGKAFAKKYKKKMDVKQFLKTGKDLLENDRRTVQSLVILAEGFENSEREVQLIKVSEAYQHFKQFISYYGMMQLLKLIETKNLSSWIHVSRVFPKNTTRKKWKNIGSQLLPEPAILSLVKNIHNGKITSWEDVHNFYNSKSRTYATEKFLHAFASLLDIEGLTVTRFTKKEFLRLIDKTIATKEYITRNIYESRAKDYENDFRKMVYDSEKEMETVLGKLKDNSFINDQKRENSEFARKMQALKKTL